MLLANTYHLLLRPGPSVFEKLGGIHKMCNWSGSVLTDSGGFQIFSLPHERSMSEEGATFKSYVDGTMIHLSPEISIATQKSIGSDIMMVLDQCIPSTADHTAARNAMDLTHRWAKRSLQTRGDSLQSMFAIVQGACFQNLRRISADTLTQMPFDGFAIGGLAVGESKAEREDMTEWTAELLPKHLPRYLMGVGTPSDLLEAVHRGVDMFDCILPNSLAQQGVAFTSQGRLELRRGVYKLSDQVLDAGCSCVTCRDYSRGYLHHLVKTKEILGWQLIGEHNLYFYHQLMNEMREHILADTFAEYYKTKRIELTMRDEENPIKVPKRSRPQRKPLRQIGQYEVHVSEEGFARIRHLTSGEVMHSVSDPIEEANRLYVDQSRLASRIQEQDLVIWDVGLGAAANAMAAIRVREGLSTGKTLKIVSFENDLDSLKLALANAQQFKYLWHSAPQTLLDEKKWISKDHSIEWNLIEGNFLEKFESAPLPDVIFYDPFSFKTNSELWTLECFQRIANRLAGRSVELFTYSASTAVRSHLLAAGFFVAKGAATGPKAETTIALTPESIGVGSKRDLLSDDWLGRWKRSEVVFSDSVSKAVTEHEQFA